MDVLKAASEVLNSNSFCGSAGSAPMGSLFCRQNKLPIGDASLSHVAGASLPSLLRRITAPQRERGGVEGMSTDRAPAETDFGIPGKVEPFIVESMESGRATGPVLIRPPPSSEPVSFSLFQGFFLDICVEGHLADAFHPTRLTISTFVRSKRTNNMSLSVR